MPQFQRENRVDPRRAAWRHDEERSARADELRRREREPWPEREDERFAPRPREEWWGPQWAGRVPDGSMGPWASAPTSSTWTDDARRGVDEERWLSPTGEPLWAFPSSSIPGAIPPPWSNGFEPGRAVRWSGRALDEARGWPSAPWRGPPAAGSGGVPFRGTQRGRGPKGYVRSDERIREDVCDVLADHPWIDASEIEVQVKGGEVFLSGSVPSREEKRLAEDVIESISGVKEVSNQLRVHRHGEALLEGGLSRGQRLVGR